MAWSASTRGRLTREVAIALHSENDHELDVRREDRVALRVFAGRLRETIERAIAAQPSAPLGEVELDVHVGQPNRVTVRGADDPVLDGLVRGALGDLGAMIGPPSHTGHGRPPARVTVAVVHTEDGCGVVVDHPEWQPDPEELLARSVAVVQEMARQRKRDALRGDR